jgi:hypothetical protein
VAVAVGGIMTSDIIGLQKYGLFCFFAVNETFQYRGVACPVGHMQFGIGSEQGFG